MAGEAVVVVVAGIVEGEGGRVLQGRMEVRGDRLEGGTIPGFPAATTLSCATVKKKRMLVTVGGGFVVVAKPVAPSTSIL